jgi:heat shock protein HspQ
MTDMTPTATAATPRVAKFPIGAIVRHRLFPFRGVVFDVDAVFANTDEWWEAIPPEVRPHKDQPFYHLLAVGSEGPYVAYVSEQNLVPDAENGPVAHPAVADVFAGMADGIYVRSIPLN